MYVYDVGVGIKSQAETSQYMRTKKTKKKCGFIFEWMDRIEHHEWGEANVYKGIWISWILVIDRWI